MQNKTAYNCCGSVPVDFHCIWVLVWSVPDDLGTVMIDIILAAMIRDHLCPAAKADADEGRCIIRSIIKGISKQFRV